MIEIVTGDARELVADIEPGSIDVIFTDPPYLKGDLWTLPWLDELGGRLLRPGGWLFAYAPAIHLPYVFEHMGQQLDYFWLFPLLHTGANPRVWSRHLMSGYKPVMVYTKGKPEPLPWMNTVHRGNQDKRFHAWGQGEVFARKMLSLICPDGGRVLDPFCGGGTVPAVCKQLGLNCLAFELNVGTAEKARQRVAETAVSFFAASHDQKALW